MRNTNYDASNATMLDVADEWPLLYSSCNCIQVIQKQEQPSTNSVEEIGHFLNATRFYFKKRDNNIATLKIKVISNHDKVMSQH